MNKQNYTHGSHTKAQGSKKNVAVREIVLMFTLLGVAAALLAPLPALGEGDSQDVAALTSQVPLVENPVFTQVEDDTSDQSPSSDIIKGRDSENSAANDEAAGDQRTDGDTDAEGGSNSSGASTDSVVSGGDKEASSTVKEDEAATNTSSEAKPETGISGEAETKDETNNVVNEASDDQATSAADKGISAERENSSQLEQTSSTTAKDSAKSETDADKEASAKDDSGKATTDDSQADKEDSSTIDADTLTVDKLPGLGPDAPFYTDAFASRSTNDPLPEYTVTFLPNGGGGSSATLTTTTGNITLPTIKELGFTPPAGALFVGWSTSSNGHENVYASDVMYPDNASHTAVLVGDTTLYAIWLMPGAATNKDTAYYFIRADGLIPFEPSSYSTSLYIPSGNNPVMTGTLNWGISITNNLDAVEANLSTKPTDEEIQAAMERQGKSFDPKNQEVIWYVIKTRTNRTWNVDGIIIDKADYLVSYNPNGGDSNVPAAQAYKSGDNVTVSFDMIPDRPGYTFLGWSEDIHATTPTYVASSAGSFVMPANHVTLYAVWEKSTVQLTYVSEATEAGSVSHDYDEVYSLDGTPVNEGSLQGSTATAHEGYLFQGWYKRDNAGNDVLVTTDATLSEETAVRSANYHNGIIVPTVYVARFAQVKPAFTLSKTVENEPANGTFFAAGEEVKYTVTVTNTGNVALENISFKDTLAAVPSIDTLAVGETKSEHYSYVVTEEDTKADVLTNTVEATAHAPKLPDETVTADPASTNTFVGTLLPGETYALFAPYPANEGSVDQSYNIINSNTGEGIVENTAEAKAGYEFEGWYKEGDDTLITTSPTLTVDDIKEHMNQGKAGRSSYGPTLFIAHFTPVASEPDNPGEGGDSGTVTPGNPGEGGSEGGDSGNTGGTTTPDTPDKPSTPDKPTTPDTPGSSDKPVVPNTPSTPGSGTDSGEGNEAGGTTSKPGSTDGSGSTTTPTKPSETTPGSSSGTNNGTTSGGTQAGSTVQTPTNELGPTDANGATLSTPSPVTADGITPTDVPASSIKAEDIDSNTTLAQTDDYVLKVLLGVTLGGAAIAALALVIILLTRKRNDS